MCHPEPGRLPLANGGEESAFESSRYHGCRQNENDVKTSYYIYILASRTRSLYTGVTNDLSRRMTEHRDGLVAGFTSRYRIFRLVHVEAFGDVRDAIAREKEIKGWRREKKVWLIQSHNPVWDDLSKEQQIPHRRPQKARPGSE